MVVETEYCRLDLNEIHRLPHRGRTVEAEVSGDEWFTARIVFGGAVVKEELHKALTSLPSSVQRVKGLVTCQGGEVLHIEVAGGTVDIAARDRQVPEANLDVLVAIATVPVVDSLRRAFQEIQGVRVVDTEAMSGLGAPSQAPDLVFFGKIAVSSAPRGPISGVDCRRHHTARSMGSASGRQQRSKCALLDKNI